MPRKSSRPGKHGPEPRPRAERFSEKVDRPDGPVVCWPWTGYRAPNGYGRLGGSPTEQAHRVAWELASGAPVPPGMVVIHVCDNRACVRNDEPGTYLCNGKLLPRYGHLALGTHADNLADMRAKGRDRYVPSGVRGEKHGKSKLTEADVIDIRLAKEWGYTIHEIAPFYGVAPTTISRIWRRELWTHLP